MMGLPFIPRPPGETRRSGGQTQTGQVIANQLERHITQLTESEFVDGVLVK